MTTLWEITVKYTVGQKELTEHEGSQVVQCWHDTEPIQDTTEKMAKFKKLLGMKFGPKGNSVYELVSHIPMLKSIGLNDRHLNLTFESQRR